jgi:hypothetical protein
MEVETVNDLGCGTTLVETVTQRYLGAAATIMRNVLRPLPRSERHRWVEEQYRRVMGEDAQPRVEIRGLDAVGALEIVSTTEFPLTSSLSGVYESDTWLVDFGSSLSTLNRHHPYLHQGALITSRARYQLCPTRNIAFVGATLDFESEFGQLRREYETEDDAVLVTSTLDVPRAKITVRDIERYNRFLRSVLEQSKIWFELEPSEDMP